MPVPHTELASLDASLRREDVDFRTLGACLGQQIRDPSLGRNKLRSTLELLSEDLLDPLTGLAHKLYQRSGDGLDSLCGLPQSNTRQNLRCILVCWP